MTLIFNGDFQTGNKTQYELEQAPQPGGGTESSPPNVSSTRAFIISEAPAGTSLKYSCRFKYVAGDPVVAGSQRSELQRPNPYEYPNGAHWWLDEWLRVPEYDSGHYHLLRQFHEIEEATGVAVGLYLEGTELKLHAGTGSSWWVKTFPGLNTWFHIKMHIVFSATAGIVEVWYCKEHEELVKQTLQNGKTTYENTNTLDQSSVSIGKTATHVYDKCGVLRSQSATGTSIVDHSGTKMFNADPGELYPIETEPPVEPPVEPTEEGGTAQSSGAIPLTDVILAATNPTSFASGKTVEICARGSNSRVLIYRDEALTETVPQPLLTDAAGRLRENVSGSPGAAYLWRREGTTVDLVYGTERVPMPRLGSGTVTLSQAQVVAALGYTPQNATTGATEEAARIAQGDMLARNGLKAKYYWAPTFPSEFSSKTMVASNAFYLKFIPHRNMTVRGVSFVVNEAAGSNDKCAVAVYNNNKERLGISAETESKLNSTGLKDIDLTGDLSLTAGKTYYAAIHYGTAGGTLAKLMGSSIGNVQPAKLFGEEMIEDGAVASQMAPTFPFATLPAASTVSAYPVLLVRER